MSKRNVVHVEIAATDVAAASKFYQELFGWKMQHVPEFNYTMWEDGSGFGGGFDTASDENPLGKVLVYIDSDDIEADLKKAEQLGGKIVHPKMEIPGTGWFGIFEDPDGNQLALYTSVNPTFNKIQTLHPDKTKQGVRIDREKYELVRSAILTFLRARGSLTFIELGYLVEDALLPTFNGSVMWYYTTVKLDLEARGEIKRIAGSHPQKIELTSTRKGN